MTDLLEKDIEKRGGDYARDHGQAEYKFTSPGRAAVPDRLHLAPIPKVLRPIIAKYIRFVEYKRGGQKPTVPQQREHARLREMGFTVEVIGARCRRSGTAARPGLVNLYSACPWSRA